MRRLRHNHRWPTYARVKSAAKPHQDSLREMCCCWQHGNIMSENAHGHSWVRSLGGGRGTFLEYDTTASCSQVAFMSWSWQKKKTLIPKSKTRSPVASRSCGNLVAFFKTSRLFIGHSWGSHEQRRIWVSRGAWEPSGRRPSVGWHSAVGSAACVMGT